MHQETAILSGKVPVGLGIAASGGVVAPTPVYGTFLTENGFWLMSYAEWFKVIGCIYIILLIIGMIIKAYKHVYEKVRKRLDRSRSVKIRKYSGQF